MTKKSKEQTSPIINNFKLYKTTDNPFLSLVFDFSNSKLDITKDNLYNFIEDLSKQISEDIQVFIILSLSSNIPKNETIKSNIFKKNKIKIHIFGNKDKSKNFLSLLSKIKGRFLIVINKMIRLEKEDFQNIYNITKGSIDNIYELKNQKKNNIYIIRTKIIKNIIDKEKEFLNFKDIINYIYSLPKPKLNYIPIIYCPDNYYSTLTYTSMISILITRGYYTYILFHLIIPLDFSQNNILFIESLYEQFDYFNISFITMDNRYKNAYSNRYITKNSFFRLSIGELLPNLDKIIYLDADTIILKDLSRLYNINFLGKIILARIFLFNSKKHRFIVNTGVLLLNLKGMRKIKIEKKALTLLNNGFRHPIFHDQAIINIYFKKYIGFLSPEYNAYPFSINKVKQYEKESGRIYNFDSLYFAFKFPTIVHYRGNPENKTYNQEDWYFFARKSKYFQKRSHNLSNIFNFTL